MKYKFCPYDLTKYATDLRRDSSTHHLMWDNARGQDVMIIRSSFGDNPINRMQDICQKLEDTILEENTFNEVAVGIWVQFVSAADKSRLAGCPLHGGASTYTVLSYENKGDVCEIYAPQDGTITASSCHIPLEIKIKIEEVRKKATFFGKEKPTGFFSITFPDELRSGYIDGDLLLQNESLQIPINQSMVSEKTIYAKADKQPVVISRNKGLKLL